MNWPIFYLDIGFVKLFLACMISDGASEYVLELAMGTGALSAY